MTDGQEAPPPARVEADAGGLRLGGRVTFENAEAVADAGVELLGGNGGTGGPVRVDLAALVAPGSVAVAVLLAWYRASHERGRGFELVNAPVALRRILDFTGLDEVLLPPAAPAVIAEVG
jgi:anti-anti-sigma regulatory factor